MMMKLLLNQHNLKKYKRKINKSQQPKRRYSLMLQNRATKIIIKANTTITMPIMFQEWHSLRIKPYKLKNMKLSNEYIETGNGEISILICKNIINEKDNHYYHIALDLNDFSSNTLTYRIEVPLKLINQFAQSIDIKILSINKQLDPDLGDDKNSQISSDNKSLSSSRLSKSSSNSSQVLSNTNTSYYLINKTCTYEFIKNNPMKCNLLHLDYQIKLLSGQSIYINNLQWNNKVNYYLSYQIDNGYKWSLLIPIHTNTSSSKIHVSQTYILDLYNQGNQLLCNIKQQQSLKSMTLTLYCDYWFVNRTNQILYLSMFNNQRVVCTTQRSIQMESFLYANSDGIINKKTTNSIGISLSPIYHNPIKMNKDDRISILNYNKKGDDPVDGIINLKVAKNNLIKTNKSIIKPAYTKIVAQFDPAPISTFNNTQICGFTDYYLFENLCHIPLELKHQYGSFILSANTNQTIPFSWPYIETDVDLHQLKLTLAPNNKSSYKWTLSSYFRIDQISQFTLFITRKRSKQSILLNQKQLKAIQQADDHKKAQEPKNSSIKLHNEQQIVTLLINIEIFQYRGTILIRLSIANEYPYKLLNNSLYDIKICQKQSIHGDDDNNDDDDVLAGKKKKKRREKKIFKIN